MMENYARQSSLRLLVGFEKADLSVADRMFAKRCGVFMENSFALFSSLFKVALKRTQVTGIKQIKFSAGNII